MTTWRLLKLQKADGAMQMAIDEAIARARSEKPEEIPNTLRFYIWNPPTITLGYGQQINTLNLDKLKEKGFGYVRRMTGGTAVLHKNDLTYSIITTKQEVPNKVIEAYKLLSKGLVFGLRELGLNAEYRHFNDPDKTRTSSCYSNENEYDVIVNDKKISGNAQACINNTVLQHGTIIIEDNINDLFSCLNYPDSRKEELIGKTKEKLTCIEKELGRKISFKELEAKLIMGFKEMGINLVLGELTDYEKELANKLYKKYSAKEWNFLR